MGKWSLLEAMQAQYGALLSNFPNQGRMGPYQQELTISKGIAHISSIIEQNKQNKHPDEQNKHQTLRMSICNVLGLLLTKTALSEHFTLKQGIISFIWAYINNNQPYEGCNLLFMKSYARLCRASSCVSKYYH